MSNQGKDFHGQLSVSKQPKVIREEKKKNYLYVQLNTVIKDS